MMKFATKLSRIILVLGTMVIFVAPLATVFASTERHQGLSLSAGFAKLDKLENFALQDQPISSQNRLLMLAQNNDIGPDGLKRRGDGSIDDDQPGVGFGPENKQLIHNKERNRKVLEDGTAVRTRTDTWVTPDGAVVRERTDTRSVLDGTKTRERTERRFDAEGNVTRERSDIRTVDRSGHRGRMDSIDRPDRSGKPDRIDRSGKPDRPDRLDDHSGRH